MKDYVYIFMHIPKCAGSTLRFHIKKNLRKEEQLLLSYDSMGLNPAIRHTDTEYYKESVSGYFESLSKKKKDNIKVVYGHLVPYGVHKYFSKPSRYITFIRDPVNRTVSFYNYKITTYKKEVNKEAGDYKATLLINNKVPSFRKWLMYKYNTEKHPEMFSMCGLLKMLGYCDKYPKTDREMFEILKKFYFVGITERFDLDILFIYNKLGFNKFFINQNISKKKFKLKSDGKIKETIISKNKYDLKLYKKALYINYNFRERVSSYSKEVRIMKIKRTYMPITQMLFSPRHTMLRVMQALKR